MENHFTLSRGVVPWNSWTHHQTQLMWLDFGCQTPPVIVIKNLWWKAQRFEVHELGSSLIWRSFGWLRGAAPISRVVQAVAYKWGRKEKVVHWKCWNFGARDHVVRRQWMAAVNITQNTKQLAALDAQLASHYWRKRILLVSSADYLTPLPHSTWHPHSFLHLKLKNEKAKPITASQVN